MPRNPPIRINKGDRKEFARLVKNTKAKIGRTKKNYGIDLSSEVTIPSIEDFGTRKQFNQWKQQMSSFTNRANLNYQYRENDYGVVANKAEIQKAERMTKLNQRRAKAYQKEIEKKPFFMKGKQSGTVGQEMAKMKRPHVSGVSVPPDFDFRNIKRKQDLKVKLQNIEKRNDPEFYDKRNQTMRENFISILEESTNNRADELVRMLRTLNPDDFFELYISTPEFDFDRWKSDGNYLGSDEEAESDISQMISDIQRYERGDFDTDLKDF